MIVVYTAVLGPEAPPLHPVPVLPDVDCVCFTDRTLRPPAGWRLVGVTTMAPRLRARQLKLQSTVLFPEATRTVWVDASFELLDLPRLLAEVGPLLGLRHPDRTTITTEGLACVHAGQADPDTVAHQLAAYAAFAATQQVLTTTGLLVREVSPAIAAFDRLWLEQIHHYTLRDQLAVDWCAAQCGLSIGYLQGHYRDNPYARYHRRRRAA